MWIRSEEGSIIVKCDNIYISSEFVYDGIYYKIYSSNNNKIFLLGIYSNKEVAMKVMNEIHFQICSNSGGLYQMPKECVVLDNE